MMIGWSRWISLVNITQIHQILVNLVITPPKIPKNHPKIQKFVNFLWFQNWSRNFDTTPQSEVTESPPLVGGGGIVGSWGGRQLGDRPEYVCGVHIWRILTRAYSYETSYVLEVSRPLTLMQIYVPGRVKWWLDDPDEFLWWISLKFTNFSEFSDNTPQNSQKSLKNPKIR